MNSFGNRKLCDEEDVFTNNAWDQYEWTEKMELEAKAQVDMASKELMPKESQAKFWEDFYGNHESNFFKDRKWLTREFPELLDGSLASSPFPSHPVFPGQQTSFRILEVGCGAGNSVTPLLEAQYVDDAFVYACDFSAKAVSLVQSSYLYDPRKCFAFQQDISKPGLTWPFPPASIDAICVIFVLSAINPNNDCLRPGGIIFFRDYGRYDMAQMRFKKGRCITENFYTRGDGTCVYFFEQDEVRNIFTGAGLSEVENNIDRRLLVNRQRKLKMYRVWIQAKYTKPVTGLIQTPRT